MKSDSIENSETILWPIEDLHLPSRILNALKATRPDLGPREMLVIHLLATTENEIAKHHGVGQSAVQYTVNALNELGFAFGDAEFMRAELAQAGTDKRKIIDILEFGGARSLMQNEEPLVELKLSSILNEDQNKGLKGEFLKALLRDDQDFQQELKNCQDKLGALAHNAIQKKLESNKPVEPS